MYYCIILANFFSDLFCGEISLYSEVIVSTFFFFTVLIIVPFEDLSRLTREEIDFCFISFEEELKGICVDKASYEAF
uniref:Uncharacterized protein n=1 Tax=Rhizophora mucronata TaxID=61149 RepID=A0A2P2NIB8_RHIMU